MNHQRINTLRMNLTVMNTFVLIGLSIFIAVVFFVTTRISRDSEINNTLEAYCAQLAGETSATVDRPDRILLPVATPNYADFQEALAKNAVSYIVWDETFESVSQSDYISLETDLLKDIIKRYVAERQHRYWITDYKTSDKDLRICTYAFVSSEGAMKTVQVIKDMSGERGSWFGSLWIMLGAIVLSAAAAALCGYFLSGRSLIPIKETMERQREFMADASHELRTPIAVIRTNLEVVRENREDEGSDQREWLDNAYGEAKRMQRIVEDMMFLARADADELAVTQTQVDLGFLCAEMTERMMPMAMDKGILLMTNLPEAPMRLMGDEKQLEQLLVILLDNGVKYSEGGTEIVVSGEITENELIIRVKDQGIGIPPEEVEKVFDRFYRVDKVRSRAEGGTGLGLSIAATIVARHKGTIRAMSDGRSGTTMEVVFPVKEDFVRNQR